MEETIDRFCKALATSCNHIQSSCEAIKQSVERRPIPLDSASSTFVQSLNRRVSSTSNDLNLLESMSFGTVSFEELLGHCNEVYKKNHSDLLHLQDHLKTYGYIPEFEIDDSDGEGEEAHIADTPSPLPYGLDLKTIDEDPLFEESLSLKSLGLSDVCLATLASETNYDVEMKDQSQPTKNSLHSIQGKVEDDLGSFEDSEYAIHVSKDDYELLPSQMKYLTSWEDLLGAVEKINSSLKKKIKTKEGNIFHQDGIESLGLGRNWRSYVLLLIRMNRLVIESVDGTISYRVL